MSVTREDILKALSRVIDPGQGKDLVAADMVRAPVFENGTARFILEVDPARGREMGPVLQAAEAAVGALPGVEKVQGVLTAHGPAAAPAARARATAADIHGPSQARMLGLTERPRSDGDTIIPLHAHGLTAMSIGLMLPEDEAVIWRGPMLMGALQQMMNQVRWGELDVLVVDLPPGTGDVALSLCQKAEVTGALIVSTPQDVALLDAKKAVAMFRKLETPVLGLIENMSVFVCPHCGQPSHIFGHDGAKAEAKRLGLPFLGEIPLHLDIRVSGDAGAPIVSAAPDAPQSKAFRDLAAKLIENGVV